MQVFVAGATGFVGSALIPALLDAGHSVRALVRNADDAALPADVEVVEGDLLDPNSLAGALDGIEAAFYLVHSLTAGAHFAARDRAAAMTFAAAASDSGVDRVIYLGGLGETGDVLSEHLASRREVEAVLAGGRYELTVLRAAIIIGAGSSSFVMIRQLAERLPLMITPRWVRTPCQPIAIGDVVAYLVGLLDHPQTAGETYDIGGPEVLSYETMLKRTARLLGQRLVIIPVPILSPAISVYWVDLVTDVPKHIAHPLIYGLRNPVVVTDGHRIRSVMPFELTTFDEAVRSALASAAATAP